MQSFRPFAGFRGARKQGFVSVRLLCGVGRGRRPFRDSYDYTRLLQSCVGLKGIKQIHAQIIAAGYDQNLFLSAKLVSQYVDLGGMGMEDARHVFGCTLQRDVLLWNVMIRGYATWGPTGEAISIYDRMRRSGISPNCYTYPFVLKACAATGNGNEKKGREIHGHALRSGLDSDLFVANALVAFHAKCGDLDAARKLFDGIPLKDLVSWNSMIAGYSQSERAHEALSLLHRMLREDTAPRPDRVSLVSLLPTCTKLGAVQEGMWIHSYGLKSGMEVDAVLGSGLIGMYSNCGHLTTARHVFDRIPEKNVVVWNAMIRGYGMHGYASEALELFSRMLVIGVGPDGVCFLSVLSACSHVGMVGKGWEIFGMMDEYGVEKGEVHYACMVDLLGRAGQLLAATEFIRSMPMKPEKNVWGALLGACRKHSDVELAEEVAERLFLLDPENAGRYVALAKMYEDVGRREDAAWVRKMMRERGVKKPLGCSAIEVDGVIQTFGIEDDSHQMMMKIYDALEGLGWVMEEVDVAAMV